MFSFKKHRKQNKSLKRSVDRSLTFSLIANCFSLALMTLCFLTSTWCYFSETNTVTLATMAAGNWNVSSEISVDEGTFTEGIYTFKFDPSGSTGNKGYSKIVLTIPVEDEEDIVKTIYVYYPKDDDGNYLRYQDGENYGEYIPVIFKLQMSQTFKVNVENIWDDLYIPNGEGLYVHNDENGILIDCSDFVDGDSRQDTFIIDMNGITTLNIDLFEINADKNQMYFVISDECDLLSQEEWSLLHPIIEEEIPEEIIEEIAEEVETSPIVDDIPQVPVEECLNEEEIIEENIEVEELSETPIEEIEEISQEVLDEQES